MVVYGMDQLDEISMSAPTKVCEIRDGSYRTYEICPERLLDLFAAEKKI